MERGELTKGYTLALASTIEAMVQMGGIRGIKTDALRLIRKLRVFRTDGVLEMAPKPHEDHPEAHEYHWLATFHPLEGLPNLTKIRVGLICDGSCRVKDAGHRWTRRQVDVTETVRGRRTITDFGGSGDDPLVFRAEYEPFGG